MILNLLKNIFTDKPLSERLKTGSSFGVLAGTYLGEIFVFIRREKDVMHFLSIPKMHNRSIPVEKFNYAITERVIEYIERIPRNERIICELQFDQNRKS